MPQRESCEAVEPLVLENAPFQSGRATVFGARYHYGRKLYQGYILAGDHAKQAEVTLTAAQAALLCSTWIHGWITEAQRTWLYNAAAAVTKDKVIVEIGAWKGKSTVILGWGSKSGKYARVYSVDPHEATPLYWIEHGGIPLSTWPQWRANIEAAGVMDVVVPFRESSLRVRTYLDNQDVGLLFVDGDHDYAMQDADRWWPRVSPGGFIALHDTQRVETLRAIALLVTTEAFSEPDYIDSMAVFQRKG